MTTLAPELPIKPFFRKVTGHDNTPGGSQVVLNDVNVKLHRINTDPGLTIEGNTARRRWVIDGVKAPYMSYRITCVTKGQMHTQMFTDETKTNMFRDEHRPVGFIGGSFNPQPGWHILDADVPGTEWFCCFLKDKRVKDGTVPTYIELNQGDQLPVFSTTEPNLDILMTGALNIVGIGNLPDGQPRSFRGDIGLNRVVSKIGPGKAQLMHCFLQDEDYGRLD